MTRVMRVQVRPTLEFFGLEHGEAQVEEHHYGHGEKNALDPGHTRSSAQISPSITRAKPKKPRTARKSAMGQLSMSRYQREMNRRVISIKTMSTTPPKHGILTPRSSRSS